MILLLTTLAVAAPAVGDAIDTTLHDLDGQAVPIPNPEGRSAVIELIRSPDW